MKPDLLLSVPQASYSVQDCRYVTIVNFSEWEGWELACIQASIIIARQHINYAACPGAKVVSGTIEGRHKHANYTQVDAECTVQFGDTFETILAIPLILCAYHRN